MVKFEFTLNDVDASNLISILHDEKMRALEKVQTFVSANMSKVDRANADWYAGHAEYLEGLKQKVLAGNSRVGDDPEQRNEN